MNFGFERIAEWWFGTDIVDLYRNIHVTLEQKKSSKRMIERLREDFVPVIDALQCELDKKHLSSELHVILKKT